MVRDKGWRDQMIARVINYLGLDDCQDRRDWEALMREMDPPRSRI